MNQELINDPMLKDIEQQTNEWMQRRAGKCTASRVADILVGKRGGYLKSRADYLDECVVGRFGVFKKQFVTKSMERGNEIEGFARANYETRNKVMVEQISFIDHPFVSNAGASPDALIGDDGLLEIKCPDSDNQSITIIDFLCNDCVPEQHIPQMAWQLACSGRKWVDFVSFDDRCPEALQYFQIRYMRDEKYIEMLTNEVIKFNSEVDAKYNILMSKLKK